MITQQRLKERLFYCQESGIFTWKERDKKEFLIYGDCITWNKRFANKKAGYLRKDGYITITIDNEKYLAHRLASLYMTGEFPKEFSDHIDCDRSNNRWSNLRNALNSENLQNQIKAQKSNKTTGLLGCHYSKSNKKFVSTIQLNRKHIHLGLFNTAIEAHEAYVIAKRKYHEFNTL